MRTDAQLALLEREFGRRLRTLREEKGWSQEELADRCHIHRTYVSQLERGLKSPTLRLVWILCDRLSVKPGDFFSLVETAMEEIER